MKNKLFYLSIAIISVISLASCASRKYGCPNSTGFKSEPSTIVRTAA